LFEKKSATAQERDQALAALRAADAQLTSARAQALSAGAARDAARAGAEAADIGLSYAVLTSPIDGVVAARHVDPGAMAIPGTPLLTLEEGGPLRLEARLDEARAGAVAPGDPAEVRIDGRQERWMSGTVAEVGRLDDTSHSFLVKIDLPAEAWGGDMPRTGTFGRARFAGPTRRALTVPASSLIRRGQLAFVYIAGTDARARLRPIAPGPITGDRVEILAGLGAGEPVLVTPPPSLRDGAAIAVGAVSRRAESGGR
ncbi:MAG: efflux RND transporter periplasmic adaptor subunit, partial [Vicinamibacterales bacterium]